MDLSPLEAFQRYASLGPDFLTWLLVRVLRDEVPQLQSEPGLTVEMEGPLLFISEGGEATKVTMTGDEAASAPEVVSALRQGKRLARARVILNAMEDVYSFTLLGETFDFKSIKLPVPAMADEVQYFNMRVEAVSRMASYIDELFEIFLQIRLDAEQWQAEAEQWARLAPG